MAVIQWLAEIVDQEIQNVIRRRRLEGLEDFQPGDVVQVNLWHTYCWSNHHDKQPSFFQVNFRKNLLHWLISDGDAHSILGVQVKDQRLKLTERLTICSHPKDWTLVRANGDNCVSVKSTQDLEQSRKWNGRNWADQYLERKVFFRDLEKDELRLQFVDHYTHQCLSCQGWNNSSTTGNLQLPSCQDGKNFYQTFYRYLRESVPSYEPKNQETEINQEMPGM